MGDMNVYPFPESVVEFILRLADDGEDDINEEPEEFDEDNLNDVPFSEDDICPYDGDCSDCPYETGCAEEYDGNEDLDEEETVVYGIPDIDHIVFSEPATIVFWDDGTKTVVKCMKGEKYERYAGFMAACMKKMFGSTSRAKAVMNDYAIDQPAEAKKTKKKKADNGVLPGQIGIEEILPDVPVLDNAIQEAIDEALAK